MKRIGRYESTVDVTAAGTEHVWRLACDYWPATDAVTSGPLMCDATSDCLRPSDVYLLDPAGETVLCDAVETGLWLALRTDVREAIIEVARVKVAEQAAAAWRAQREEHEARAAEVER